MAIQIQGNSGTVQEVETATRAARVVLRPIDYVSLGIYQHAMLSGVMAAGLAANSSIYQFRYGSANIALVKEIRFAAVNDGTAFAATSTTCSFQLQFARSFTAASGTGGTAGTLTGNNAKLRTSMATTGVSNIFISATGAITAGTWTLDTDALVTLVGTGQGSGTNIIAPTSMFNPETESEHPIVLAQNEGLNIRASVAATGTWRFGVSIKWAEVSTY